MKKKYCNSRNESMIKKGYMNYEEWIRYNEDKINYMDSLPNMILEEGVEDPTIIRLQPNETLEEYMKRNNLVDGDIILAPINDICNSYYQQKQNDK